MKRNIGTVIISISFSITLIMILSIFTYKLSSSEIINETNFCPIDRPISFQKIVIFDKSDIWEKDNIKTVKEWLSMSYQNISVNERFTIFSIVGNDKNSTEIKTLFDRCNPGDEKGCNRLYQNCKKIKEKYDNFFKKPLQKIAERLSIPTELKASYSPLFKAVKEVIDKTKSQHVDIYMVSDFMENGSKFNFYDTVPLGEDIIKEYPLSVNSDISFYINLIKRRRHDNRLIDAVVARWKEYFSLQGIENIRVKKLFITD